MITQDLKDLAMLRTGDVVRHKGGSDTYVVTANYGDRVTAVRTVDVSNPSEWLVVLRDDDNRMDGQ